MIEDWSINRLLLKATFEWRGRVFAAWAWAFASLAPVPSYASNPDSVEITIPINFTSPANIVDLAAQPGPTEGSIQLTWTEPGDDGSSGTASFYTIKVSTTGNINDDAQFDSSKPLSDFSPTTITPGPGGSLRAEIIAGLVPGTTYYFAMRATDDDTPPRVNSWSRTGGANPINFAKATPLPQTVTGLSGIALGTSSISWSWNAAENASSYSLYQASSPATLVGTSATTSFVQLGLSTNTAYGLSAAAVVNGSTGPLSAASTVYTLAAVPSNASIVSVSSKALTLSWESGGNPETTPYEISLSTDDFATHFSTPIPFGVNHFLLSAVLSNLTPQTTYYVRLRAQNGDGITTDFSQAVSTRTLSPEVRPIVQLVLLPNPKNRSIQLDWTNPVPAPSSILIARQEGLPSTAAPADGVSYPVGSSLGGATVIFNSFGTSFTDRNLSNNTSYFYTAFALDSNPNYSLGVTSGTLLDLKPASPSNVSANPASPEILVTWSRVTRQEDGTYFANPHAPATHELSSYNIYHSTSSSFPLTLLATVPASATSYLHILGDVGDFYQVSAVDGHGQESNRSLSIEAGTGSALLVFESTTSKVEVVIDSQTLAFFNSVSPTGEPVVLAAETHPEDIQSGVLLSVELAAKDPFTDQTLSLPAPPEAKGQITFFYRIINGEVVFSPQASEDISTQLGVYRYNGIKWFKIFGKVDTVSQSIAIEPFLLGKYQIRPLLRDSAFSFDLSGITNRFLTPNGDNKNDNVVFIFDNPRDSAFSGKIFDLKGASVSEMQQGPLANSLKWDGKSNGHVVPSGVYVYQIESEGKVFNGTVVVIR